LAAGARITGVEHAGKRAGSPCRSFWSLCRRCRWLCNCLDHLRLERTPARLASLFRHPARARISCDPYGLAVWVVVRQRTYLNAERGMSGDLRKPPSQMGLSEPLQAPCHELKLRGWALSHRAGELRLRDQRRNCSRVLFIGTGVCVGRAKAFHARRGLRVACRRPRTINTRSRTTAVGVTANPDRGGGLSRCQGAWRRAKAAGRPSAEITTGA
jgi:hypothetical protein